jgi:hypothetical protein
VKKLLTEKNLDRKKRRPCQGRPISERESEKANKFKEESGKIVPPNSWPNEEKSGG